ncbi:hypothetical protein WG66_000127, partial [Moniliophthora roreri]
MADDFRGMFKGLKNQETSEFSMCEYGLCFLKVEEKSGPAGLFTLSRSATLIYKICAEFNLTLLSHTGAYSKPPEDAELRKFVCVPFTGDTTRCAFRDVFTERQCKEL